MNTRLFYFSLYMALLGGNWIVYHVALPVRIAHHLLLTALLVYWLLKRGLPDTPLLLPVGLMAAALTLSGIHSIDQRMALEYGWHWLTNWLLFLFLIDYLRQGYASSFFKGQFAAGAILAVSCILQWLAMGGRPSGVFGVINLTGAYLAALVVPALGWAIVTPKHTYHQIIGTDWIVRKSSHRRTLLILFMVLAAIGIYLNQSRGPVLSVLVALTAFGLLSVKGRQFLKIGLGVALMGLCALILVGLSLQPGHSDGDMIRMDLWKAGEDMLMDYPTGVGAGLFAQAYHQRTISEDKWTGAHNYYINLGAEMGAPGLAASAIFLLVAMYYLIGRQRIIQRNAALAALIGVLAHMVADNYPAQNWSFLIALYAAYLLYEVKLLDKPVPLSINRLLVYGLMVYGLLFGKWDLAQIHYEAALQTRSVEEAQAAVLWDPQNKLYQLEVNRLNHPGMTISSDFAITNYARISY